MQVLLRIANGKSNVRKVRIQSDTVIGRSPDCQLKVASNQISRRHCQIVIRDTVVAIKDLGSANGTFVNGRQVPPEVEIPLTPGTRVMLGPLQFTVEYDLPGVPGVAALAPAIESEPVTAPQSHVETLQVIPDDQQTPFPPLVVSPPQVAAPAQQVGVVAPSAPVRVASKSPALTPAAPPPTEFAIAAVPPAVATPVIASAVPAAATPVAVALPPAVSPAPVAPQVIAPAVEEPDEPEEEDTGAFNFGIFAASGSGVVVESVPEIAMTSEPEPSVAPKPDLTKPEKKGFLQMLGWGKKKPAAAVPEVVPETAPPPEETVVDEEVAMEAPVEADGFAFGQPVEEEAASADDDSTDESLQNFFNNFK